MLYQQYVTQPVGGINYLSLFDAALQRGPFDAVDIAVAYATANGVRELTRRCRDTAGQDWDQIQKRWLVGIDYCRTEPIAIEMLNNERNSFVKIHDGRAVVLRRKCTPLLPFHPKTFIFWSNIAKAILSGSGNLSRNGLTRGHEVGSVLLVREPRTREELAANDLCIDIERWFNDLWTVGSDANLILREYTRIFESVENMLSPVPNDDDAGNTDWLAVRAPRRALSPEQLRHLRACKHLWIEAGNLTRNRGPNLPGNQLMLSRMTRVFFGFPSTDVTRDTHIGDVQVSYETQPSHNCSLRFSNNSMDVLVLPIPGDGGPDRYDNENLLFERMRNGTFRLTIGTNRDKRQWNQMSARINGRHSMTSGREWGVF